MRPYGFLKKWLFRDEEDPQTKYTGSNYRKRKQHRRIRNKAARQKGKRDIEKEENDND